MENDRIEYKRYTIWAKPDQLESGQFQIHIFIEKHNGNNVNTRPFLSSNSFSTKEETIKYCFDFGMKIIDGKIQNCSVNDL